MKIHFIGIGGIGVSALAQYYLEKAHEISGSDLTASEITEFLKGKGIKIFIGNSTENIKRNFDLVIYSPAVKPDNPELKSYKEKGIKCLSYPEALGELTKEYFTIAVSGSHGKSTTTAMIALILIKAELDPTVIVGTKLKEFGNSNFKMGNGKCLVIEACEYDSSFLRYQPEIIVITNIDKEHLDYFKTFAGVKKAFNDFIARLPAGGFLVFNKDDVKNSKFKIQKLKSKLKIKIINYSAKQPEALIIKANLKIPGEHNVSNALAALTVARILKVKNETAIGALSEFKGTWRRFEERDSKIEKLKNVKIISDYAHHPNEIRATLKAAREKYPVEKIWCVFQPHQNQRTYYLFNDFVKTFYETEIDNIIITDIYNVAGRETEELSAQISSKKLVEKIKRQNVVYCATNELEKFINANVKSGDILIIMGAGDIYKLADKF
ncbi:MAG: UDP-N-acetylmuramate--L-alanine ligase [Candidatus Staskawiczbacteria bacterium RIFOXYD2_FULL_37_9]|uniref:UDP-N-acetylmuramate--L-alanine ligase n=1 Tax=Candidatus Staskawiczbacteria bacterium RIFOXYB1_FULL_37_44 TaxID=1802223 RepID=A0A1G2IZ10_9BACT|nr:MAG: UDP-N-acetylmuramate--L-alanine ligase [Candidatus Staskawiczbacteria bacterium RIFOXYB1_FULL_37_44]OGZ83706.1 MAG: UDP-N-acetylmuramate--L-alanine ligase [Candidatus Staskawiczbacteria bacterium RIFOXYC1_FULL_37_52]OGZ87215.1 MAG: UDP-N-acetylmuramate--L-alanine ligase [Candidatus Staskawiczbacteria bacterium RIFOXYC2_FULL_37_19]OGZ90230.1 MAG: UDP-N-acetylmuramate--L-alanine ligase [Candidatus Staskawiczbacteria bacterium RIFOXYD1_FULL_37_110]OGZ93360.1 MAG: UDP-N-acetylmuramate--L-al